SVKGTPRSVPSDIEVAVIPRASFIKKLGYAMLASSSFLFFRELQYLWLSNKLKLATFISALRSVAEIMQAKSRIKRVIRYYGKIDIAYSYWNSEIAYALCLFRRQGTVARVASRAHRSDLYESIRSNHYMPLKRQFVAD